MKYPDQRIAYSAIVDRPPLPLPDGARLVVWVVLNIEHWDARGPMPRRVNSPPAGAPPPVPDVPNWAWHEYGMRVGFWRMKEILERFRIPATVAINGSVCTAYPRIAAACRDAGWEFMGHGFMQKSLAAVPDERDDIRKTIQAIRSFTGKPPRGWLGPGLVETLHTADVLAEEGIEYVADWVLDDQPCELATSSQPIISLPYTQEINDVPMFLEQQHSAAEFRDRALDQFEQLYADGESAARVMCMALHPFIVGAPHRAKYFRQVLETIHGRKGVLFWTGGQILDWYLKARPVK